MKIVHISDIHFGTEIPLLIEALLVRIGELGPDLVIASGDFTMAARTGEYRAAASMLDRLGVPVLATPGNHDMPVYNLFARFFTPFARYDRWIAPRTLDRFVSEKAAILSLNSARPWDLSFNWSHGRLSNAQIAEADRFFAGTSPSAFRALVVHHPFYVPEELPGFRTIGNGDAMLDVLARRGVQAVFSGHLHHRSETARTLEIDAGSKTVHLFQVGTVTSHRHRGEGDQGANGFSLVEIDSGPRAPGGPASRAVVTPQIADGAGFVPGEPVKIDLGGAG